MAKPISQFFVGLGLPLRNIRWSWGARGESIVLLRTWQDEYSGKERKVTVLRDAAGYLERESFGLDERLVQLQALWQGDMAGYSVIAEVKDPAARPREIKDYRDDGVFAIKQLEARLDGGIAALLGELVPVKSLVAHAKTHRTAAGVGAFPADDALRSGLSTDTYLQKVPAIRPWLIEVCQTRGTVTYSDVMNRFALTFYPLRNAMSRLGRDCRSAGEPIITAVIVDKDTGRCSEGLQAEFGVEDDQAERELCYAWWAPPGAMTAAPASVAPASAGPEPAKAVPTEPDDFEHRVARFALVELRPHQAAFRLAVFRACGGRCVVSGCAVPEALEAAHFTGRDWHDGHNTVDDGVLLRRDLHALYDRGLLKFTETGLVQLDASVGEHYEHLQGASVVPPAP